MDSAAQTPRLEELKEHWRRWEFARQTPAVEEAGRRGRTGVRATRLRGGEQACERMITGKPRDFERGTNMDDS